jgi:HSP20 family protein
MAKSNQTKKKNNGNGQKRSSALTSTGSPSSAVAPREPQSLGTPFTFMRRFSEEMDRLFEDFGFGRGWLAPGLERSLDHLGTLAGNAWVPQVEVMERDNQLVVRADLPGMSKDDVKVDLDDNSLVIRGERKSEREEDEEGYYRSERSYGSFYRRIPLPSGVKAEEANADFRDGVLEITMPAPKRTEEKHRQIEIRGEGETARAKAKSAGHK